MVPFTASWAWSKRVLDSPGRCESGRSVDRVVWGIREICHWGEYGDGVGVVGLTNVPSGLYKYCRLG